MIGKDAGRGALGHFDGAVGSSGAVPESVPVTRLQIILRCEAAHLQLGAKTHCWFDARGLVRRARVGQVTGDRIALNFCDLRRFGSSQHESSGTSWSSPRSWKSWKVLICVVCAPLLPQQLFCEVRSLVAGLMPAQQRSLICVETDPDPSSDHIRPGLPAEALLCSCRLSSSSCSAEGL